MREHGQNIVIVEDDESMSQAIERLVNAAGFHAVTYPSAESLLSSGGAAQAGCLILDIRLPGMSGFELRQRLAQSGAELPVIFVTAHDEPAFRAQAEQAGALAYFTKPFPGRSLIAAITQALTRE